MGLESKGGDLFVKVLTVLFHYLDTVFVWMGTTCYMPVVLRNPINIYFKGNHAVGYMGK